MRTLVPAFFALMVACGSSKPGVEVGGSSLASLNIQTGGATLSEATFKMKSTNGKICKGESNCDSNMTFSTSDLSGTNKIMIKDGSYQINVDGKGKKKASDPIERLTTWWCTKTDGSSDYASVTVSGGSVKVEICSLNGGSSEDTKEAAVVIEIKEGPKRGTANNNTNTTTTPKVSLSKVSCKVGDADENCASGEPTVTVSSSTEKLSFGFGSSGKEIGDEALRIRYVGKVSIHEGHELIVKFDGKAMTQASTGSQTNGRAITYKVGGATTASSAASSCCSSSAAPPRPG